MVFPKQTIAVRLKFVTFHQSTQHIAELPNGDVVSFKINCTNNIS